ncbi:C6 transcription factor Prf [Aspergillus luchuensis]|uniref:C6 transcription factor Prf n=1 Tax=Aspergillus kawachii TaxID=1069201 RepID=A0A146FN45_ASPKA|nr:C6 transcription factor Prf [Aspergillus luchuensis]
MADNANRLPGQTQASPSQPQLSAAHEEAAPIAAENHNPNSHYIPRPKRIACVLCRRRKLRCDGKRPSCGTCSRLGHECIFDEVRKKSGPKRGYVKQLEARLGAQVQQSQGNSPIASVITHSAGAPGISPQDGVHMQSPEGEADPISSTPTSYHAGAASSDNPQGSLISLGLEEPLPTQEVIDELQYMIWCHAASVTDKYSSLHSIFYERARKYAELDELEGLGERVVSISHCQTWVLIGTYEFKMMFLPRAWLSVGKAARLATMLGLCGIDEDGLNVKQTLPPSKDWSEKEERRRVFWMAFCLDRYASVGTGWPVSFDERDVSCSSTCFNVRE